MKPLVTVFTPTYNRAGYLGELFESLKSQTNHGFKWFIIDDGSTDNTEEVVKNFFDQCDFEIEYMKKENGGKHTALNIAFRAIDSDYTFIVDSDDTLTQDAIQRIYDNDVIVRENNLAGMCFLKGYDEKKVIGTPFPEEGIFNDIELRYSKKIAGDKMEIWRTNVLKCHQFPEFKGERFQGENYVWWKIAFEYDMLYINKIIYIAEYLPDGLSKSGKKLRISCPLGGMENSKVGFNKKFPLRERIKRAWLFICYGFFAKMSVTEMVKKSENWKLIVPNIPFGWLLYIYWNKKYN